jgi:hypothetical protein
LSENQLETISEEHEMKCLKNVPQISPIRRDLGMTIELILIETIGEPFETSDFGG